MKRASTDKSVATAAADSDKQKREKLERKIKRLCVELSEAEAELKLASFPVLKIYTYPTSYNNKYTVSCIFKDGSRLSRDAYMVPQKPDRYSEPRTFLHLMLDLNVIWRKAEEPTYLRRSFKKKNRHHLTDAGWSPILEYTPLPPETDEEIAAWVKRGADEDELEPEEYLYFIVNPKKKIRVKLTRQFRDEAILAIKTISGVDLDYLFIKPASKKKKN